MDVKQCSMHTACAMGCLKLLLRLHVPSFIHISILSVYCACIGTLCYCCYILFSVARVLKSELCITITEAPSCCIAQSGN